MALTTIDGFVVDVVVKGSFTAESEATKFPIESGATMSDHIVRQPIEVSIESVVSDSPPPDIEALRTAGESPSAAALAHLLRVRERGEPVTIVTANQTYENMALVSLEVPESSDESGGLWFTARFQKLEIITNTRTVNVDVATPRGQGKDTFTGGGGGTTKNKSNGKIKTTLWRKAVPTPQNAGGRLPPPGGFPTEIVFYDPNNDLYYHSDGVTPLTGQQASGNGSFSRKATGEFLAYFLDMQRDAAEQRKANEVLFDNLKKLGREDPKSGNGYKGPDSGKSLIKRAGPPHVPKDVGGQR